MLFYKGKINSWDTGEEIILNIKETYENIPYSSAYHDIAWYTQQYPNSFDHTATYIANNTNDKVVMESCGFTNVIIPSGGNDYSADTNIFLSATHVLKVSQQSQRKIQVSTNGGISYTPIFIQSYPGVSLPAINLDSAQTIVGLYNGNSGSNFRWFTTTGTNYSAWYDFISAIEPYLPSTDPYADAGDSTTGGGDGSFDGSSDPVNIPPLPTVGATDAGFITLFAPTPSQLKALASYMWSSAFDIEGGGTAAAFKKLFNDPMDCILGLSVVPVAVPTSGAREITIGNLVTTVSMNVASQQYIEVNCGSVDFTRRFFGSYLDYEPYTKMALFVPYSGVHAINADDIIGRNVSLVYHIDILTGSLVAFLKCGDSVLYEFNGACASNIPVNSLNYASTIENAIRIAVNIGTTVATAGAAAPAVAAGEGAVTAAGVARGISLAGSTAEGAISMKPGIDRAGSLGGTTGLMGNQIPYFIITRPRLCKPANQDFFEGYPSFIQNTIGGLIGKGFTSFTDVVIAGQYLTDAECAELETILKGGVYL